MNKQNTLKFIDQIWDNSIVPALCKYIQIPNKSPAFDPHWEKNGYMEQAVTLLCEWCKQQNLRDLQLQVYRAPGKTPLIVMEIPGKIEETILLYGHLDKQPEMTGWDADLGPWKPVIKNNRLYGRGGADDGYSIFAAVSAIKLLQEQNLPHARCIILIEASEESASVDLPFFMDQLQDRLGTPSLIICLDSGCGNYEQLWCTTSLRGLANLAVRVEILTQGVHSGAASGIAPSSFRILRQLLTRIEDENTGQISLPELNVTIPAARRDEAQATADALGDTLWRNFPFIDNAQPVTMDKYELILNRTWRPTLSIIGIGDIPSLENAGNVLRPATSAVLSIRLPPTCDASVAAPALKKKLEANAPYSAKITVEVRDFASGWNAPTTEEWLKQAIDAASLHYYGKNAMFWGEGGSIPFMNMLGRKFPQAQFMITGVLGPHSNAHGPNEFLDIAMAKKLTCCVAEVISQHFQHFS